MRANPGWFSILFVLRIAAILASLFIALPARAEGFRLELKSPARQNVATHSVVTPTLNLINDSAESRTFKIAAEIPEGWGFSANPSEIELGPGESSLIFTMITVPGDVPTGEVSLVIKAFPGDEPDNVSSVEMTAVLSLVVLLDLQPLLPDQPDAFTGDRIVQSFTITNKGNARDSVQIDFESRENWPVSLNRPEPVFTLAPGQSETFDVTIEVPAELPWSVMFTLNVTAHSLTPGFESVVATARTNTNVVTRELRGEPLYATVEGQAGLLTAWSDESGMASWFTLRNIGCQLTDERQIHLQSFSLLQTGDSLTSFSQSRAFSFSYNDSEHGYAKGGEFSLNLDAPLIGRRSSGTGADVLYRGDSTDYRMFFTRGEGSLRHNTAGVQVAQHIDDENIVRMTFLKESGGPGETDPSYTYGLFAENKPSQGVRISAETAWTDPSNSKVDNAWRLNGAWQDGPISVSGELLRAGDGFLGQWSDLELRRLVLSWRPTDDFNLWTNYYFSRNNLAGDPDSEARRIRNINFGGSWDLGRLGSLRVSRRNGRSEDVFLNSYDDLLHSTTFSLSRSWQDFSASATWLDQETRDLLDNTSDSIQMFRLNTATDLNAYTTLRLGYTDQTFDRADESGSHITSVDLGLETQLSDGLGFSLDLQRSDDNLLGIRTNLNGEIIYEFENGRMLSLLLRSFSGSAGSETNLGLEFIVPFSIPLTMLPRKGGIEGRVFYEADPERGIPNARMLIGQDTVVTNENGEFSFSGLDPGESSLDIDIASLGVCMKPSMEMPLLVAITAGSPTKVDIAIIQTAGIAGKVMRTDGRGGSEPLSSMAVKLEGGDLTEPRYRISDDSGRFVFADLNPGVYTATILENYLPEWTVVLDPAIQEIELSPSEVRDDIVFTIGPKQREIEITTEMPSGTEQQDSN